MNQAERRVWLINALLDERPDGRDVAVPAGADEQRDLLRALMNVRPPEALTTETLDVQDAYLHQRIVERGGATDAGTLPYRNHVAVWRGDITLLKADAIVNAANSQMLGCFVPGHHCIDNAIHTYAGMQLRLTCANLMCKQGHEEPTARVKVTPAFNLPSSHIFHTVGPIVLDEEKKSVTVDGDEVALTPIEFNILRLLMKNPGRIYSSAQIYELVWKEDSLGAETSVSVHIRHLRQKLEINPSEPRYLKVVWGLGYKMEDKK